MNRRGLLIAQKIETPKLDFERPTLENNPPKLERLEMTEEIIPDAPETLGNTRINGGDPNEAPNITYPTNAGKYPSWSTVKTRYWNLTNGGKVPTGKALVRMQATGELKTINVSKELHHINGRIGGDPHNFSNLIELWPWEHSAVDPARNTGYDFIEWVK